MVPSTAPSAFAHTPAALHRRSAASQNPCSASSAPRPGLPPAWPAVGVAALRCQAAALRRSAAEAGRVRGSAVCAAARAKVPLAADASAEAASPAQSSAADDVDDDGDDDAAAAGSAPDDSLVSPPPVPKRRPRRRIVVELSERQQLQLLQFWQQQGVLNPRHLERLLALSTTTLLFRSPTELAERVQQLRSLLATVGSMPDVDVGQMVGRQPQILCGDIAHRVRAKLPRLMAILPGVRLQRMLERQPQLLQLDTDSTLILRCQDLIKLLPDCDILGMINACPQLLTVSVPRCIAPHWAALQWRLAREGVANAAALAVIQAAPRLLVTDPATVDSRIRLLQAVAPGVLRQYASKPAALARLVCASETALYRLAFVAQTCPDKLRTDITARTKRGAPPQFGPTSVVSMPSARFCAEFPAYQEWEARRARAAAAAAAGGAAAEAPAAGSGLRRARGAPAATTEPQQEQ